MKTLKFKKTISLALHQFAKSFRKKNETKESVNDSNTDVIVIQHNNHEGNMINITKRNSDLYINDIKIIIVDKESNINLNSPGNIIGKTVSYGNK